MTPYYSDDWLTVYQGDARTVLATLEPESVHCVVTSPPYWGLRDYGTPGQLGLEATPEEYVAALVDVFREVRRVLRDDGTCWVNMGDAYAHSSSGGGGAVDVRTDGRNTTPGDQVRGRMGGVNTLAGLKPKDLVGIPWRVAFALQADGWYLRSDVIWSKPNPMPESVTDRPTKSHEYLFLLSKTARYYFDADAVRETNAPTDRVGLIKVSAPKDVALRERGGNGLNPESSTAYGVGGRNLRTVWTIATEPYPGAHFATFPRKLVEPCVKAGTSERGVCPECEAPWERETERATRFMGGSGRAGRSAEWVNARGKWRNGGAAGNKNIKLAPVVDVSTTGWHPSCVHDAEPVPATVLDLFAGTGTVGLVAQSLSRRAVLIDLNADYLVQCLERNRQTPLGLVTA